MMNEENRDRLGFTATLAAITLFACGCNLALGLDKLTLSNSVGGDSGTTSDGSPSGVDGSPSGGDGSPSGGDGSSPVTSAAFAYVANSGNGSTGSVTEYTIGNSGVLTQIGSVSIAAAPAVAILAHPNGAYIYVVTGFYNNNIGGYSNGIGVYAVGAADGGSPGQLTLQSGVVWTEPNAYTINSNNYYNGAPFGIALDSTNTVLMCISPYTIHVFNVNSGSGGLSPYNPATISSYTTGAFPNSGLAAHPTQPYVYVVNSANTLVVQAYSVNSSIEPVLSPTAAASATQSNNNFYGVFVNPKNSYLYTSNNGSGTISTYPINSFGGLGDAGTDEPAGGPGTSVITGDPLGRFVYALNGAQVFTFTFNATAKTLTSGTTTQLLSTTGAVAMGVEPTSNYLYIVYESSSQVGMFGINQTTGALSQLGPPTVTTGTSPRGIAFSSGPQ